MRMEEVQSEMLGDLHDLGDAISQYSYILECASYAAPFPARLKDDAHLVRECQARTWIEANIEHKAKTVSFCGWSESLIVCGALSMLEELYDGRPLDEVASFSCRLLDDPLFTQHFSSAQIAGLKAVVAKLSSIAKK